VDRGEGKSSSIDGKDLGRECLSLPLFPELTEDEVRTVAQAVRVFFAVR
jgi:dTDP-4-amino-4,6-dideoxygalactose transaminase